MLISIMLVPQTVMTVVHVEIALKSTGNAARSVCLNVQLGVVLA